MGLYQKCNPTIANSFATMKSHEFHAKSYRMTNQGALQDIDNIDVLESNNLITLQRHEMSKRC
jgi:hypothetical protein